MRVLRVDEARGAGAVRGRGRRAQHGRDRRSSTPVARAPTLLVHAGTAIARLEAAAMRFVDEFRDAELGRAVAGEILATVEPGRHYKVMEVCGGHTHSIYKYGIDDLLPANVELVHGPGCPVCVIPMGRVDDGIALAKRARRDLHLLRRHDARARLARARCIDAKAEGADVRMVYSPLDALRIAKAEPGPRGDLLRDRVRDHRARPPR